MQYFYILILCLISKEIALQNLLEALMSFYSSIFYKEGVGLFSCSPSRVRHFLLGWFLNRASNF